MNDVTTSEAGPQFADLLHRVLSSHERVRITKDGGELVAAVISREDLELLEELERLEDEADAEAFREAEADDDGVRIPFEEIKARHGL